MTIQFNQEGLVPVIVQDATSLEVLMLAYMNVEAYEQTLKTKQATYYSRSRKALWVKGETSGHHQKVVSMFYDCDQDALLLQVIQEGAACHTGHRSCFYTPIFSQELTFSFNRLYDIVIDRKLHPVEGSYTNYLLTKGLDKILKKVGEETSEVIIAAKNNPQELIQETSDLFYHLTVLLVQKDIHIQTIFENLRVRHGQKDAQK
jgi:phosphoribosyl-ATP pyrophosphohydrolase/phosphoribosyl-AMP cyclohydrolase